MGIVRAFCATLGTRGIAAAFAVLGLALAVWFAWRRQVRAERERAGVAVRIAKAAQDRARAKDAATADRAQRAHQAAVTAQVAAIQRYQEARAERWHAEDKLEASSPEAMAAVDAWLAAGRHE